MAPDMLQHVETPSFSSDISFPVSRTNSLQNDFACDTHPQMPVIDLSQFDSGQKTQISKEEFVVFQRMGGKTDHSDRPRDDSILWSKEKWDFWCSGEEGAIFVFKEENGNFFVQKTPLLDNPLIPGNPQLSASDRLKWQLENLPPQELTRSATVYDRYRQGDYYPIWEKIALDEVPLAWQNADFGVHRYRKCDDVNDLFQVVRKGHEFGEGSNYGASGFRDTKHARAVSLGNLFFVQMDDTGNQWLILKKDKVLHKAAPLRDIADTSGLEGFATYVDELRRVAIPDISTSRPDNFRR